ncbi:hypothetical protein HX005_19550, partial [Acinetobacter sp. R933-2]|uniref:phage tailspike polysaccharide lyase family protein n=1 Tax=Acinetobacter sp. R933-2 TaxID=2746728 RepID=UPI00257504CF
ASNCQDLDIYVDYAYAHRHACAMGGANVAGAIPNRRVNYFGGILENSNTIGVHCADIHGNAIDCKFIESKIFGMARLGGERCYTEKCTIIQNTGEVRPPILVIEPSGECGSLNDTFTNTGSSAFLIGLSSIATARLNNKQTGLILKNANIYKHNLTGIMSAVTVNSSNVYFVVDGFSFKNGTNGLDRIISYSESPASG